MIGLINGRISVLVTMILMLLCIIFYLKKSEKNPPPVRKIPAIEGIEEGIGRAIELGRPVHWTAGYGSAEHAGGLGSKVGLSILSGLTILAYVAKLCASKSAKLITTFANPEIVPLASELIRDAYLAENKLELFDPESVMFISSKQYAYVSGVLGTFQREKIGTNIMTGAFSADALLIAEGGAMAGAFQVAGSSSTSQLPLLVPICDYTLIGEELFAAAAYISEDTVQRGTLRATDVFKFGIIVITVVGIILEALGIHILSNILNL